MDTNNAYTKKCWYVCKKSHNMFSEGNIYCFCSDGNVYDQRGKVADNYNIVPDETLFRKWIKWNAKTGDIMASNGNIFAFHKFDEDKNIVTIFSYHDNVFHLEEEIMTVGSMQPASYRQIHLLQGEAKKEGYVWDPSSKTLISTETFNNTSELIDDIIEEFKNTTLKVIEEEITSIYRKGLLDALKILKNNNSDEKLKAHNIVKEIINHPTFDLSKKTELQLSGYDLFQ